MKLSYNNPKQIIRYRFYKAPEYAGAFYAHKTILMGIG